MEAFPTLVNAVIGLASVGVFASVFGARVFSGRFIILAMACLGLSGFFDHLSNHEYPAIESGAIVLTGASSGIGRSAAIALAKKGFDVYCGVRKDKDAESLKAENIPGLIPIILDVVNTEHIEAAVKVVADSGKPLVGLVNNAGILSNIPIEAQSMQNYRKVFDVNVFGLVECTQNFLPLLRKSKGRIINMGSIAGDIGGMPGWNPYTASKHAVESISDALRNEMSDFGVSVSLIKPGSIQSDIWKSQHQMEGKPDFDQAAENMLAKNGRGGDEIKALYKKTTAILIETAWDVDNNPATPGTDLTDTAIVHAMTSKFPKTRYLVAPDAHVFYTLDHLLPDRVMDRIWHWFVYEGGYKQSHAA